MCKNKVIMVWAVPLVQRKSFDSTESCFGCEVEYAKAAIASLAKKESFGMEVQEVKLVA